MISVAKKKKKRRVKLKNILIFFLILIGIISIFYYAIKMPIHNIYIENNEIVSDDEVIKLAKLENYPSFLLTKKSDMEKNIKKNQYIEDVKIQKKFGNIILISVKEYQAVTIIKEKKLLLSNGLEIENTYDLSDIPVLVNEIEDKKVYRNFAKKLGLIKKDILRQISQIEYNPSEVDKERFLLYMSDGNIVYITLTKITKLNKYNQIKDKLEGKTGIIYLDAGDYVELNN